MRSKNASHLRIWVVCPALLVGCLLLGTDTTQSVPQAKSATITPERIQPPAVPQAFPADSRENEAAKIPPDRMARYLAAIRAKGLKVNFDPANPSGQPSSGLQSTHAAPSFAPGNKAPRPSLPAPEPVYHFRPAGSGTQDARFSGINPAQGLQFDLDSSGLIVTPDPMTDSGMTRDAMEFTPRPEAAPANSNWLVSIRLQALSRGASASPVADAMPTVEQSKISYERRGITEWYVNNAYGLEQGFTLEARPQSNVKGSKDSSAPLRIEMALDTTLTPILRPDRQGVEFSQEQGPPLLAYSELHVQDARGISLPAHLELAEQEEDFASTNLTIVVDDCAAAYPITVDPMLQVQLVKDINTLTEGGPLQWYSSYAEIEGMLFFCTRDIHTGYGRLWKTDGTDEGTSLIKEMPVGTMRSAGSLVFFVGYEPATGWELWKSDGTDMGTVLVKDIKLGPTDSAVYYMVAIGSTLLFMASDLEHGRELWRSDGTESGTYMVKDIRSGTADGIYSEVPLKVFNGILYFGGLRSETGLELWRSDGTEEGTFMVKDICPGSCSSFYGYYWHVNFEILGNILLFNAYDPAVGVELWKTDGTAEGTVLVKDHEPAVNDNFTGEFNGEILGSELLYFWKSSNPEVGGIWKTDGTTEGTSPVKCVVLARELTRAGQNIFFSAIAYAHDSYGRELWKTDGSSAGTCMVKDILPGNPSCNPLGVYYPWNLTAVGDLLFFSAYEPQTGAELWKSDGTAAGTVLVKDLNPDAFSCQLSQSGEQDVRGLKSFGGMLFFWADDYFHGIELYSSDGTEEGTVLFKDVNINTRSSLPGAFTEYNGALYFLADDGLHGYEIWKTDGTPDGTVLLKDISPGLSASYDPCLQVVGEKLLFLIGVDWDTFTTYTPSYYDDELWTTDGTEAGTIRLKGKAQSIYLCLLNDKYVFTCFDQSSQCWDLWASDGTEIGTKKITNFPPNKNYSPSKLILNKNLFYFMAWDSLHGWEPWRTDGTEAGTFFLADLYPGPTGSLFYDSGACGDFILFSVETPSGGREPWKSDGTPAGTTLLKDINPGSGGSSPGIFAALGNLCVFRAYEPQTGYEMWRTDGTAGGTVIIKDLNPGPGSSAYVLYASEWEIVDGVLYYLDYDSFYRTDGTEAGTRLIKSGVQGKNLMNGSGKLFFRGYQPASGEELWVSDGTGLGTMLVKDIKPGSQGSSPQWLPDDKRNPVNGVLFFRATDSTGDNELWASDGTENGTFQVANINPNVNIYGTPQGSQVENITPFQGRVYFRANDGSHGTELFSLFEVDVPPAVTITGPVSGFLAPINTAVSFAGTFSDWIWDKPHTAIWSFTSATVPLMQTSGLISGNDISGSMAFSTPGIYTVELAVTDNKGTTGTAGTVNGNLPAYIVVFDPLGNFVTGGGWIWSPPGAYRPGVVEYAMIEGKATFGFVAKYQKGANVPTGDTEFQFKAGDLNFKSREYQWLVVAGARAQYKGSGTINGGGDYGFMLTAIDGQMPGGLGYDRFRIKIWDKATDLMIYDNLVGAGDNAELPNSTIIQGGSIVIH